MHKADLHCYKELSESLRNFKMPDFGDKNNKDFSDLFKKFVDTVKTDKETLSELLGVSLPTIDRWYSGTTRPHRFGQKPVFDELANYLDDLMLNVDNNLTLGD